MKIACWNMAHSRKSWDALVCMADVDIALLQVADEMCDVLNENRIPRTAELDAWERALHRLDSERGSRQSDGRTGEETRLVKSETRVVRELDDLGRRHDPWNLLNDEIAARAVSPVGAGAWGTA